MGHDKKNQRIFPLKMCPKMWQWSVRKEREREREKKKSKKEKDKRKVELGTKTMRYLLLKLVEENKRHSTETYVYDQKHQGTYNMWVSFGHIDSRKRYNSHTYGGAEKYLPIRTYSSPRSTDLVRQKTGKLIKIKADSLREGYEF